MISRLKWKNIIPDDPDPPSAFSTDALACCSEERFESFHVSPKVQEGSDQSSKVSLFEKPAGSSSMRPGRSDSSARSATAARRPDAGDPINAREVPARSLRERRKICNPVQVAEKSIGVSRQAASRDRQPEPRRRGRRLEDFAHFVSNARKLELFQVFDDGESPGHTSAGSVRRALLRATSSANDR